MTEAEHEYIEYVLDVKDGQIVGCEYFGEGRQVTPIDGVAVSLMPDKGTLYPRGWEQLESKIKRVLVGLTRD